jgi:hypothetical protein
MPKNKIENFVVFVDGPIGGQKVQNKPNICRKTDQILPNEAIEA